ncbi:MAG: aminopeptidase [Senegalia sp. (in: firmicutes)]
MKNFDEMLKKYADIAVNIGINIQKDQVLFINSSIDNREFVHALTKSAFEAGAKDVMVNWGDSELAKIRFMNAPDKAFKEFPQWKADGRAELAKNNAAFLSITGEDPDIFKDVDSEKMATNTKTMLNAFKEFRKYTMASKVAWCVVAAPSAAWAKKVIDTDNTEEAIEALWEKIFKMVRVDKEDPVAAWKEHTDNLEKKAKYLNDAQFKKLHYKSSVTDLEIELPKGHIWTAAGEVNDKGTYFVANLPTEEVFTMPHKDGVNGTVKNTKPFNYNGNLIDDFTLTFKDGKVVDFKAGVGEDVLKKMFETDEGAMHLGEVALVPHDSPISNTNMIFFNTLFDENASCHLAFGKAYPTTIKDGSKMSEDELKQKGVNESLIHEDFMVGSADMNIIAEKEDGEKIQIFKDGNWSI